MPATPRASQTVRSTTNRRRQAVGRCKLTLPKSVTEGDTIVVARRNPYPKDEINFSEGKEDLVKIEPHSLSPSSAEGSTVVENSALKYHDYGDVLLYYIEN